MPYISTPQLENSSLLFRTSYRLLLAINLMKPHNIKITTNTGLETALTPFSFLFSLTKSNLVKLPLY
jgi:hypothetical protein